MKSIIYYSLSKLWTEVWFISSLYLTLRGLPMELYPYYFFLTKKVKDVLWWYENLLFYFSEAAKKKKNLNPT